jgi:signal transduction histidine kinase
MQSESEIVYIFSFFTLIATVLLAGIFFFIFQYRKRKMLHQAELNKVNQLHIEAMLSNQIKIQRQTMLDIGREIHDNVGQRLTLASIYSGQLLINDHNNSQLVEINKILAESLDELRNLSKSLTNESIEIDLVTNLIEQECLRISELKVSNVTFKHTNLPTFISSQYKFFILRILQEFSQNSLKHSNCKNIYFYLTGFEKGLLLELKDDGKGFDTTAHYDGIGLKNMRSRTEIINGSFNLQSSPTNGTKLKIVLSTNN